MPGRSMAVGENFLILFFTPADFFGRAASLESQIKTTIHHSLLSLLIFTARISVEVALANVKFKFNLEIWVRHAVSKRHLSHFSHSNDYQIREQREQSFSGDPHV